MKYFFNLQKYRNLCDLSFEKRLTFTLLGLFSLVFLVAMVGEKITNLKLAKIFDNVQSRNMYAAKKNLEHDLLSWQSNLQLIANSSQISQWYDYRKYGLKREAQRSLSELNKFFTDAEKNKSGLLNIRLSAGKCEKNYEISSEQNQVHLCVTNKLYPISILADGSLTALNTGLHQFVPDADVIETKESSKYITNLEKIPTLALRVKDVDQATELIKSFSMILPITLSILFIGILLVLFLFWSKLIRAQTNVLNYIANVLAGKYQEMTAPLSLGFADLESTMKSVVDKVIAFEHNQKEVELLNLSKQISHDIRSPLSALNSLSASLTELPESKRILVRNSINRINDIANSLLERGKNINEISQKNIPTNSNGSLTETLMISSLVDSIVSEKRIQFRGKQCVEIEADINQGYGLFANISGIELKRTISNLINNSVESFTNESGKILVSVKGSENHTSIIVKDNGVGIPDCILKKLGTIGVSHGKEGTQSGSGLGIYHAKKTIEAAGGIFQIFSTDGIGTTITIIFKRILAPNWFVEKLLLSPNLLIFSLDDDISIHQIWQERFQSKNFSKSGIEHKTFTSGLEFKTWIKREKNLSDGKYAHPLYLVDYELLNQHTTGLDIIEELGIGKQSILVTSRYEEAEIRERCGHLGVRLIPKAMAGFVPIEITNPGAAIIGTLLNHEPLSNQQNLANNIHTENLSDKIHYNLCLNDDDTQLINQQILTKETTPKIENKIRYDLCLLDDDRSLVQTIWAMVAKTKGHKIKIFSTPEEFQSATDSIDRETPIFIDVSLGNGVSGVDFSEEVHKMGFLNINLATGYSADSIKAPSFIGQIIGKDYPEYL